MAYAAASDVAALTRVALGSASEFSASSKPTEAQITAWLSAGCSIINAKLASRGYGTIPATAAAYDFAAGLNATYAAWRAEESMANARTSDTETTRGNTQKKNFTDLLKEFDGLDFSVMGVAQTSVAYAGGISQSDKDTVESDTDRVTPRFARGMFANPEGIDNPVTSAS